MTGDEQRRLCAQCGKHVHNLSALPPRELRRFVEERDGTECIAYVLRTDGTMITASRWSRLVKMVARIRLGSLWLLAFLLPSFFAGCAQRTISPSSGLLKGTPLPGKPAAPQHRTGHRHPDGQIVLGEFMPPEKRPVQMRRQKATRD